MAAKDDIRPLYAELRGYLAQAPVITGQGFEVINSADIWDQYNKTIALVSKACEEDFSRFKISPIVPPKTGQYIYLSVYRQRLGGIISYLHAKYFADEPDPSGTTPSMVITQNQQQSQSITVQMLLDLNSKIDEHLLKGSINEKEKGFLQKVKDSLSSVNSVISLISLILKTAQDFNLDVSNIGKLFGI